MFMRLQEFHNSYIQFLIKHVEHDSNSDRFTGVFIPLIPFYTFFINIFTQQCNKQTKYFIILYTIRDQIVHVNFEDTNHCH